MNLIRARAFASTTKGRFDTLARLAGLGMVLSGCTVPVDRGDSSVEGELVVYVARYENAPPQRSYAIRTADGNLQRLSFDVPPRLPPGTTLRVWGAGEESSGVLRVGHYEAGALAPRQVPTFLSPQVRHETYAFVIVDLGQGPGLTTAQAMSGVFGAATTGNPSFAQFFAESSYGAMQVSGDVIGPLTYNLGTANWSNCAVGNQAAGISQLTNTLLPKITKKYDHYMWYLGPGNGCNFGGISEEGTATHPAVNAWYANLLACGPTEHEVGHNHGFFHENSMTCKNNAAFSDTPMTDCTSHEYGFGGPNTISVMGQQCGHDTAYDKWYEGWLAGCNGVKVRSSGTFTLLPIEIPCGGIQALQVPMPKTRQFQSDQSGGLVDNLAYYYLELREAIGADGWVKHPAVYIHVAEDVHSANNSNTWDWILDTNPSTQQTDGLGAGQTFTDPAGGVSFTVEAIDTNSATVQVTIPGGSGAPTCIDGTTLTPPGPSGCGTVDGGTDGGSGPGTGGSSSSSSSGSSSSGGGASSTSNGSGGGSNGSGGGSTGEAGSSGSTTASAGGGSSSSAGNPGASSHCSCRAAGEGSAAQYPALLGGALAIGLMRRRRGSLRKSPHRRQVTPLF
jgi:MYXO-CTERM domain-containing protein